ncbi:hypothetical protein, partial [Fangia hongkongensis]
AKEYLDKDGWLYKLQDIYGDEITYHYNKSGNQALYDEISDTDGHKLTINYQNASVSISSQSDGSAKEAVYTLNLGANGINKVYLPEESNPIAIAYEEKDGVSLIQNISYPQGKTEALSYQKVTVDSAYVYGVDTWTVSTQDNSKPVVYQYDLDAQDGHNFFGSGLSINVVSNKDPLLETQQDYKYTVKLTTPDTVVTDTYNKFHLLVKSEVEDKLTGRLASITEYCYPLAANGGNICGLEKMNMNFADVVAYYDQPTKITTYSYSLFKDSSQTPLIQTQTMNYDDEANLTYQQDITGMTTHNLYQTDSRGFKTLLTDSTITGTDGNTSIATTNTYEEATAKDNQKVDLLATSMQRFTDASGNEGVPDRFMDYSYYDDAVTFPYAFAQISKSALVGANGKQYDITYDYQVDQPLTIKTESGVSYTFDTYITTATQSGTGLKKTDYYSKYTGNLVLSESQGVKTAYLYDNQNRVITKIDNYDSSNPLETHYTYNTLNGTQEMITEYPTGAKEKVLSDGAGREIESYITSSVTNTLVKLSATEYGDNGQASQKTVYLPEGELKTYYQYLDDGRTMIATSTNGITNVSAYDPVYNTSISFSLYAIASMQSSLTNPFCRIGDQGYSCHIDSIQVQKFDDANRVIAEYTLPFVSKNFNDAILKPANDTMALDESDMFLSWYGADLSGSVDEIKGALLFNPELPLALIFEFVNKAISGTCVNATGGTCYYTNTQYGYDALNRQNTVTDTDGNKTQVNYDQFNQEIETVLPNGNIIKKDFGLLNNVETIALSTPSKTYHLGTLEYDDGGRVSKQLDPLGIALYSYSYNNNGLQDSVTTARGDTISYSYNDLNLPTDVTVDEPSA